MNNQYSGWSLDLNDWELLRNTLRMMNLDWNITPLKMSRKESIPVSCGIYLISGTMPFDLGQDYFDFKTPLYVGISAKNLRNRFISHCKGELTGVRELVRTWLPANLDFQYAVVKSKVDERDIETLVYDLETELMNAFGTPANKRNQKASYLSESY